jgi:hypothetical protein
MAHRLPLKDIAFLTEFAAFCRGKGEEGYCFTSTRNCAGAQFIRSKHSNFAGFGTKGWEDTDGNWHVTADLKGALSASPRTFSALADRLEALLVDAPATVSA